MGYIYWASDVIRLVSIYMFDFISDPCQSRVLWSCDQTIINQWNMTIVQDMLSFLYDHKFYNCDVEYSTNEKWPKSYMWL